MSSNRITFCIFSYAICRAIPKYILIMATEDIMAGKLIESSTIASLFSIGDILSIITAQIILKTTSLLFSVILIVVVTLVAWLLIVLGEDDKIRLTGCLSVGFINGFLNTIGMKLISFYDGLERNVSAFAGGVAFSTVIVGILYTGATTWLCFAPRLTFAVIFPVTFLFAPIYAILNHGPLKRHQNQDNIKYKELRLISKDKKKTRVCGHLTFFYRVFPFMSFCFLERFYYRLTTASATTTLTFQSAPFRTRDHFQYYTLSGDIGRILGSAGLMIISLLCPSWIKSFSIRKYLIIALLSFGHLLFFLFATWYRFVPNVYIVLVVCATQGFLISANYALALSSAGNTFTNPDDKSLAMNMIEIGMATGFLTAGFIGLFVEKYLRQHCISELALGAHCLARFTLSKGWTENLECDHE